MHTNLQKDGRKGLFGFFFSSFWLSVPNFSVGRWGVVSQFGCLWQERGVVAYTSARCQSPVSQMFCEVWEIRVDLASESADEKLV